MKKILVVCVAFAGSLLFNTTQAQVKIGVFDEQQILGFMPGIQKVDTLLQKYVSDSLKVEYDYEMSELKREDSTFKVDSSKMNPSLKAIMKKSIATRTTKIVNWQQYQQQMYQNKQQELLKPYLEKIYAALQEVITEQKYTHIFKPDAVIIAEKSDELPLRVLHKLKIPLPKEVDDQVKALLGGGTKAPAGGAPKPGQKPAGKN